MCGIAGIIGEALAPDAQLRVLRSMTDSLRHRGPDDSGSMVDGDGPVALGHRRLAIIDLSAAGHQPMASASGRTVIAFNGEIYNFAELRVDLMKRGVVFKGHSDTEVLIEAIERDGMAPTLSRCRGMFSLALWDRRDGVVYLARDRFGEKPLYIGVAGKDLVFGSELRALRLHPDFSGDRDEIAAAQFLRFGNIPAPRTVYRDARKIIPGTIVTIRVHQVGNPPDLQLLLKGAQKYWSLGEVVARQRLLSPEVNEGSAIRMTEDALSSAVKEQLVSDVPIGAFLSGGIDSTLITALMCKVAGEAVRTFTIGFADSRYDESSHAAAISKHLGTVHTMLRVTPQDALNVIPDLAKIYDEPFADSSQIPTIMVCRLARGQVTVALSGDGGDEVFGGYNRHVWGPVLWRRLSLLPHWLRVKLADAIQARRATTWNGMFSALERVAGGSLRHRLPTEKLYKLASIMPSTSPAELYSILISQSGSNNVLSSEFVMQYDEVGWPEAFDIEDISMSEQMMIADASGYLQNDILVKVDRAAMSVGLETRAPFLDEGVVNAAWALPLSLKVRGDSGKHVLRKILARHVPPSLTERPKFGFGVPIDEWLRGPLKDWAYSLLTREKLGQCQFLSVDATLRLLEEHMSGARDRQHILWSILMWQAWLEQDRSTHG